VKAFSRGESGGRGERVRRRRDIMASSCGVADFEDKAEVTILVSLGTSSSGTFEPDA
jgi:hypothetical protein